MEENVGFWANQVYRTRLKIEYRMPCGKTKGEGPHQRKPATKTRGFYDKTDKVRYSIVNRKKGLGKKERVPYAQSEA